MSHIFKLGQRVRLLRTDRWSGKAASSDTFEVVRLSPEDQTGEAFYRIKSDTGEKAVRESEIAAAQREE